LVTGTNWFWYDLSRVRRLNACGYDAVL